MGALKRRLSLSLLSICSTTFFSGALDFPRLSLGHSAFAADEFAPQRSSKKKKVEAAVPLSPKQEALRHLNSIPQSSAAEPPTIMMPLKENYQALERRAWDWALELEFFQRQLNVPRPSLALGPVNLNQLPQFQFAAFGVGMEKTWGNWRVTGMVHAAASVKSHESNLPSGVPLDARYQWVSYGFEPRLAYVFDPHWSAGLALGFDQATVTQSSSESELAQWTQSYTENTRRVFVQYSWDGLKYVSLQSRQFSNEFDSAANWSLAVGARW